MAKMILITAFLMLFCREFVHSYSALEDDKIIREYRRGLGRPIDHARVARNLVHQSNWAAVGTISTNAQVLGFPMVNIIAIDDTNTAGKSTGKIHFLLTDLDFTGPDWRKLNKVTFLFTDEQNLNCKRRGEDPMEPTCARVMISGKVLEMDPKSDEYASAVAAFEKRHPAAINWVHAHSFYLCELEIENIFVLDFYGGPHTVTNDQYYSAIPDEVGAI